MPAIGTAAAVRLVLFILAAIVVHLPARAYSPSLWLATVFLLLAVAAHVLGLATA